MKFFKKHFVIMDRWFLKMYVHIYIKKQTLNPEQNLKKKRPDKRLLGPTFSREPTSCYDERFLISYLKSIILQLIANAIYSL